MLKALIIKELRESAGIVVLALVAYGFVWYQVTSGELLPWQSQQMYQTLPFVSDSFGGFLTLLIGAMAIALGIKQSVWELGQNSYLFLLHRPAGRRLIFSVQLLVGGGLVLAVGGLAIVAYALWVATPGNSPKPFFWSMTGSAWQLTACLLLVYLGTFLSGIRPARWFGTRLAPLVTSGGVAFAVSGALWWVATVAIAAVALASLAGIFYYAQARDY
ncbi:MAG: hypothetical protein WD669_05190 [Pirellulales bacterium]